MCASKVVIFSVRLVVSILCEQQSIDAVPLPWRNESPKNLDLQKYIEGSKRVKDRDAGFSWHRLKSSRDAGLNVSAILNSAFSAKRRAASGLAQDGRNKEQEQGNSF